MFALGKRIASHCGGSPQIAAIIEA